MKPRKRKPGRPRGTTRGGSHVVSFRVNDAQHAELEAEGPSAPAAAKRRAFPPMTIWTIEHAKGR